MRLQIRRPLLQLQKKTGEAAVTAPYLIFNGTTSIINHGSDAALDDMHDDELTFEIWIKCLGTGGAGLGRVFDKNAKFFMYFHGVVSNLRMYMDFATGDIDFSYNPYTADEVWHHLVLYFNDAGDRKIYFAIDGTWSATSGAGSGAIVSDAAEDLCVGNRTDATRAWDGHIGWYRFSDNDRYSHGTDFTPPARNAYPDSDANTILLCHVDEGEGTNLDNEQGDANRDGTISNATWGEG
jgi:hypothetical protein